MTRRKRINGYMAAICSVGLLMAGGCSKDEMGERPAAASTDSVRVAFSLAGALTTLTPATKADLPDTLKTHPLPEGETLWMTISKKKTDGSSDWEIGEPKAYVVKASDANYYSLHACSFIETTDANGKKVWQVDETQPTAPLYLAAGTYRFRLISPALNLTSTAEGDKAGMAKVDNEMYFYATDDRYDKTKAKEIEVTLPQSGESSAVQHVELNPIIQQVARMMFTLYKGENVYDLEMLSPGIEISGLQNTDGNRLFNWSSEVVADSLEMRYGDKRGRAFIREFREGVVEVTEGTGKVTKECIIGDTGVLPTNALNNSISVILNLRVNGVPTQFMTLINKQILFAAHSYNYRIKVSKENGIVVATWQNQSWGTDVTLNPKSN